LFRLAAVRAEDGFPRERLGSRERMNVDQDRIVNAVNSIALPTGVSTTRGSPRTVVL